MSEYKLPLYDLIINEDDEEMGITAIGLVSQPAVEVEWVVLSESIKLTAIEDKQLLIGAVLVPNKKIYRVDDDGEEYYVQFSTETIEKLVKKYFKQNNHVNFNMEHVENLTVKGVVQESWIIADPEKDKSALYGYNLPVGTWMLSVYIEDKSVWDNYVKTNKLKGFSIEAFLDHKLIKQSIQKFIVEPSAGETEDEFISRCIAIEIGNGYPEDQAAAMCYSKWEEKMLSQESLSEEEALELIKSMVKRYGKNEN